jgi:hypothetical protein
VGGWCSFRRSVVREIFAAHKLSKADGVRMLKDLLLLVIFFCLEEVEGVVV